MKKLVFWTIIIVVLVSVILGISSEQNVEVWGWICGVSYILLAIYTTKLLWNKWELISFARPVTALAFALVLLLFISDIEIFSAFTQTLGMRMASYGLSAVTLFAMGILCLICLFEDEKTEQPEQTEEEQNIDGPIKFACLFWGAIYCLFLGVFILGLGELIPMSLNTIGILTPLVFIAPLPLVIGFFSGDLFKLLEKKIAKDPTDNYCESIQDPRPGDDDFEDEDDDFVDDDDFEGREAEESLAPGSGPINWDGLENEEKDEDEEE